MDAKTLEALKGSIAKWEGIVAGIEVDSGSANCPLCGLFYGRGCLGCPVREETGKSCCDSSPYDLWRELYGAYHKASTPAQIEAAKAELAFLKSLLPEELK